MNAEARIKRLEAIAEPTAHRNEIRLDLGFSLTAMDVVMRRFAPERCETLEAAEKAIVAAVAERFPEGCGAPLIGETGLQPVIDDGSTATRVAELIELNRRIWREHSDDHART